MAKFAILPQNANSLIFYALLVVLVLGAVLFKDFSLLTTFASGLAGIALLCGVMSVLVVLVLASDQKEQDWRDFAAEHCKVIEKEKVLPRREWVFH